MRNLLFSTTAAISIATLASAQDGGMIAAAIDGGIEMLNADGANITFESREVGSDNSLMLSGVRMAPEDGDDVVFSADWIKFSPASDMSGGVTVTVAPVVNVKVSDDNVMLDMAVKSEDFALTTNLLLGGMAAPQMTITADSISADGGGPDNPTVQALDFLAEGLDFAFAFDLAEQSGTAGLDLSRIDLDLKVVDPDAGGTVDMQMASEAMSIAFVGVGLPMSGEEDDILAFLSSDGSINLTMQSGASTSSMAAVGPDMPVGIDSASEGGTASLSVQDGMFSYTTSGGSVTYVITPNPEIMPLPPMEASLGGVEMEVQMPVAPSDTMQQAKLLIGIRDLAVSDSAWAMIDPGGSIPRDPATLEIDLSSMLRLLMTLQEAEDADNPMQVATIDTVDLDQAHLSIGGAELNANGAVKMDNSGPFPVPNGSVDISVRGAQTLAQKLVELGLVDQMQVGMVMGMLMAFATQGDGPDHFVSTIEFKDGGIFANGQPIQ